MKFQSKRIEIEANQFQHGATAPIGVRTREDGSCYVVTIHGQETDIVPDDWIILENPPGDGTRAYPCKPDVFERRYEHIPEANEAAAKAFRDSMANEVEGTRESLERTANMLNTYATDLYPANDKGQVHFARAMMEGAADEIRKFLKHAVSDQN